MPKILLFFALLVANSEAQVRLWTRLAGTGSSEEARGVSNDGSGFIYVAGTAGAITDEQPYAGAGDVLLMKFSSDGNRIWTRLTGSAFEESTFSVSADTSGNIYVGGYTTAAILNSQNSAGGIDSFVIKYTSDGALQWTRLVGTSGNDYSVSLSADNSGSVYITGNAPAAIDGEPHEGAADIFLVKYQANGDRVWTRMWGSGGEDYADAVSVDNLGNVYVAGRTSGTLDTETNAGSFDAILIKCSASGVKQWIRLFGSNAEEYGRGVAADILGNIYVTGTTRGALPGQIFNGGAIDIFVVKYMSNGTRAWMRQSGTATDDTGYAVSTDNAGNVYVAGTTSASLDGQPHVSGQDFFLMKYDSAGDKLWTREFGTSSQDNAFGVSAASGNVVYVAGGTGGDLDGEPKPGGRDIFLMSYLDGTASPTVEPSASPTDAPSDFPTDAPSDFPTVEPSASPTAPTASPTDAPSDFPTVEPSASPTAPTASPTDAPSDSPTVEPSDFPTDAPSGSPTVEPSASPTAPTASPTDAPSASPTASLSAAGVPTLSPSKSIEGSWCVRFGLFDAFGDGWGEGAALRIYDRNDPSAHMDLTNSDGSFAESTICLNPFLSLYAEIVCDACTIPAPWEIYYSISVGKGRSRKEFFGRYDTIMSFQGENVKIKSNGINFKDKIWSCKEECDRPRLGSGNADRVFDMTGDGMYRVCTNCLLQDFVVNIQYFFIARVVHKKQLLI
jgi:hypothetical protein